MKTRYLLICKWICVNLLGLAFLVTAYFNGWFDLVRDADTTFISETIFILFVWGFGLSAHKVFHLGNEIDKVRAGSENSHWLKNYFKNKKYTVDSIKLKLSNRISLVKWLSNVVVVLGLIGTVIGFIMALSGISADVASDVNAVGPMISTLIQGMQVALYTTLVGSIFHIWLSINYYILSTGATTLVAILLQIDPKDNVIKS